VLSYDESKSRRVSERAFMTLFGQDNETFTSTMFLNLDQLQRQLDKDEFQEDKSMAFFWVIDNQFQKFIDWQYFMDYDSQMAEKFFAKYTGIKVTQFRETLLQHMGNVKKSVAERAHHQRQYEKRVNNRQMQTPINDQVPFAKVQLTAQHNVLANEQQDTDQFEPIHDTYVLEKVNSHDKVQSPKSRNINKFVEPKSHIQKLDRQIAIGQRFSLNKSSAVCEKPNTPRSCLRWIPTGRIFKTVGLRWIPTGRIFKTVGLRNGHMTPGYISSGLMQNSVSPTPYVPPSKKDYEILFQQLFDEYFNPSPRAVFPVSAAVTAPRAVDLAGRTQKEERREMQSQVTHQGAEEQIHGHQNAQFDNAPLFHNLSSDSSSEETTLQGFILLNLHHLNQSVDTFTNLTMNNPLENVMFDLSRLVLTRSQLQGHAIKDCRFEGRLWKLLKEEEACLTIKFNYFLKVQVKDLVLFQRFLMSQMTILVAQAAYFLNLTQAGIPPSMCQTISNIDAHAEEEQFHEAKQSRWQSAPASDHLNQNALLSLEPKDHPKISLGHYSIMLASSYTVKSKIDIKSPTNYPRGEVNEAQKSKQIDSFKEQVFIDLVGPEGHGSVKTFGGGVAAQLEAKVAERVENLVADQYAQIEAKVAAHVSNHEKAQIEWFKKLELLLGREFPPLPGYSP
nr:hypothetical protein [Tanacetum cinerariifolium]